jgi:hypothetical protein
MTEINGEKLSIRLLLIRYPQLRKYKIGCLIIKRFNNIKEQLKSNKSKNRNKELQNKRILQNL